MQLPALAESYLSENRALRSVVDHAISQTTELISDRPDFFPEYTDHGPNHNTSVISTSIALITDEGKAILTPSDVTTLCLAVLLHDCGMHLTPEGFNTLISPSNTNRIPDMDKESWSELWSSFLLEARRFDGRKLNELFGSKDPVRKPPEEPQDLTQRDKLLIGEFIRRNHPRIAHEIALFGFPAADGEFLDLLGNCDPDFADISGLVARSHGMDLRNAVDVLRQKYHAREFNDIHAIILMAVLRIADYLQIQSERAPKKVVKVRSFSSPFSEGEWKVHQSIRNITRKQEDPEAILIDSLPEDVETFLKVRAWLEGLQNELDKTWAILGENYGRYSDLQKLQLQIRRIRSNFDRMDEFSEKVDFVPDRIAFEASSPDLLSLLAKPLYGNDPQIGIRELVQNAADAVLEREFIEGKRPKRKIEGIDTDILVYAEFENNKPKSVIVEDRGIGMNVDIIKNYFLRAGASFRNSSVWRKNFMDESGNSKINRSGRFGIGALAAFLIGEKVDIITRRFDDEKGFRFVADLESDSISVQRVDCEIGTRVSASVGRDLVLKTHKIFNQNLNKLPFYYLAYPKLIILNTEEEEIKDGFLFNSDDNRIQVNVESYGEVYWTSRKWDETRYGSRREIRKNYEEHVFCNGIHIFEVESHGVGKDKKILNHDEVAHNIHLNHPSLYIFDRDGRLPLTLQRNSMADTDDNLSEQVAISVSEDLVAQSIAYAPEKAAWEGIDASEIEQRDLYYKPNGPGRYVNLTWTWYNNGWLPLEDSFVSGKKHTLILHSDIYADSILKIVESLEHLHIVWEETAKFQRSATNRNSCLDYFRELMRQNILSLSPVGRRYIGAFSKGVYEKVSGGKAPVYLNDALKNQARKLDDAYVIRSEDIFDNMDECLMAMVAGMHDDFLFSIISGTPKVKLSDDHIFVHKWNDLVGARSIPPCFEERKKLFPRAFRLLGDRIEFHHQQIRDREKEISRNAA